uniref:CSON003499 protein n=1 Tax=Culicoides sonorensis TaxID=179676 RepID=A0A336KA41_CULSO
MWVSIQSPNCNLFGPQFVKEDEDLGTRNTNQRRSNSQSRAGVSSNPLSPSMVQQQPLGRYAAPRPMGSMSQIIHNAPTTVTTKSPNRNDQYNRETSELHSPTSQYYNNHHHSENGDNHSEIQREIDDLADRVTEVEFEQKELHELQQERRSSRPPSTPQSPVKERFPEAHSPGEQVPTFSQHGHHYNQYDATNNLPLHQNPNASVSKMHTGQKNISSNVFDAVSPGQRMEFDQEKDEGFGVVKINRPIRRSGERHETDSVVSHNSQNGWTEQGHFDLKYHHNKLW